MLKRGREDNQELARSVDALCANVQRMTEQMLMNGGTLPDARCMGSPVGASGSGDLHGHSPPGSLCERAMAMRVNAAVLAAARIAANLAETETVVEQERARLVVSARRLCSNGA